MHHGTCVRHVPWCMSGPLTCGDGENAPGIPGACAPAILRIWQEAHGAAVYWSVAETVVGLWHYLLYWSLGVVRYRNNFIHPCVISFIFTCLFSSITWFIFGAAWIGCPDYVWPSQQDFFFSAKSWSLLPDDNNSSTEYSCATIQQISI